MARSKNRPKSVLSRPLSELVEEDLSSLENIRAEIEQEWAVEQEWGEPERKKPWDEKEASRATVRSACVAAHQRFCRSGGNPLHVWEAIVMCTSPSVAPMMLPDWCTSYLHEAGRGLLAAEGDGEKLAAYIVEQLKFARMGWTAVKARASAARAISAALRYDELRFCDNMSSDAAHEKVRESEGFRDVSAARKLVKRGHAMLRHAPLDRPAPVDI